MIHYSTDFTTLLGTHADGTAFAADPIGNPSLYSKMVATLNAQQQAARTNKEATTKYNSLLDEYNTNVQAGRPAPSGLPAKPKELFVSDDGVATWADFIPPLADPLPPAKITPPGLPGINPTGNTDDLTIIKQMLLQITAALQEILSLVRK